MAIVSIIFGVFFYFLVGLLISLGCDFKGKELMGCCVFWPVIGVATAFMGFLSVMRKIC